MTREQKRIWLSLAIWGGVFVVCLAALLSRGASTYFEDNVLRSLILTAALIGLVLWLLMLYLTHEKKGERIVKDERDEMIAVKARKAALTSAQVYGVVWCIALTEAYFDQGAVPVALVFVVGMSTLVIPHLVHGITSLVYYAKMRGHGEG